MPTAQQAVEIVNKKGLHARASNKFARLAGTFKSAVTVSHQGETAVAGYIMDLLMLAAHKGCTIEIVANGEDATQAVQALCHLVEDGFGELQKERLEAERLILEELEAEELKDEAEARRKAEEL